MIKIFSYTNYRLFLKDKYAQLKETNCAFSYRFFSKQCGYSSPNFLKLVMENKRNLSLKSIETFSIFFKFTKKEKEYFKKIVLFNQAKTSKEKQTYAIAIMQSSIFQRLHPLGRDQFEYYSKWYFVAIRELLATKKIKLDAHTIGKLLTPCISTREAQLALDVLLRLGLIKRRDNRYVLTQDLVTTGDEVSSVAIANHHREMFKLASDSIDNIKRELRDISGVTVGLDGESITELKLMIQKFRKDVLALSEREKHKQCVYQVSIQMFPLSEVESNE
ncbi:MAG: TIGR02147 family protein [Halobacteriovoraceae bacterium]|jgi:uncharacterized protein (TIGR02147 family)|nr:TIGR02147 family protein [Halobacteriovoraceae bacterium]